MRGLLYAQQIADSGQAAFVAVLVDAQAFIRLRDRAASNLDLLACSVVLVGLAHFQPDFVAISIAQGRRSLLHRLFAGDMCSLVVAVE